MARRQPRSFTEVTFIEATARRLPVVLMLDPVVPKGPRRLSSRFLGMEGTGRIALAPPVDIAGGKAFLPVGWNLGMSFELGDTWFQARTTVVGHVMYPQFPTRRVDALVVEQPEKVLSRNRRKAPRHKTDPARPFAATIWSAGRKDGEALAALHAGRLYDWSEFGLGVLLGEPASLDVGEQGVIRLERASTDECTLLRGMLRHCTSVEAGRWLAGFGNVESVPPGEMVDLMAFIAGAREPDEAL